MDKQNWIVEEESTNWGQKLGYEIFAQTENQALEIKLKWRREFLGLQLKEAFKQKKNLKYHREFYKKEK